MGVLEAPGISIMQVNANILFALSVAAEVAEQKFQKKERTLKKRQATKKANVDS